MFTARIASSNVANPMINHPSISPYMDINGSTSQMDPNGRFVALGESHQRQPGRCTCCGMEASVPMPFLSIRATSSLSFLGAAAAVFSWENMENSTRKWSFEWENHGKLMPKMGKLFYKWEVQNCFNNGQLYIYISRNGGSSGHVWLPEGAEIWSDCNSSKSLQISKHLRCWVPYHAIPIIVYI